MTLGQLIETLEKLPGDKVFARGFSGAHSYRGYYDQLAFQPAPNTTVAAMLAEARAAEGETFTGYKGGNYRMDRSTEVWLSEYGEANEDSIEAVFLRDVADSSAAETASLRASLSASQVEVERLRASLEVTTVQRDALQASLGMGLSAMSSACAADLARERESRLQGEAGARARAFREAVAMCRRAQEDWQVNAGAAKGDGAEYDAVKLQCQANGARAVGNMIERLASSASTTGAHFERERTYDQILVALRLAGFDAAAAKVSEWKAISDRFPENASTSTAPTGDEPLCRCGHSRAEHNAVYSTPYNCVAGRKCLCGFFAAPTGEPAKTEER